MRLECETVMASGEIAQVQHLQHVQDKNRELQKLQ